MSFEPCSSCLNSLYCMRRGGCQNKVLSSAVSSVLKSLPQDDSMQRPPAVSLEQTLRDTGTQLIFAVYSEDKTLRLFKRGSMLSEDTAGYADEEVVVKVMVKRPTEQYLVCLPARRSELDKPGAVERLAWAAYNHHH